MKMMKRYNICCLLGILLILLGNVNCFVSSNVGRLQRLKNVKTLNLQYEGKELELLDKLQQKLESKYVIDNSNMFSFDSNDFMSQFSIMFNDIMSNEIMSNPLKVLESAMLFGISHNPLSLFKPSLLTDILSNPSTPTIFLIVNFLLVVAGVGADDSKVKVDWTTYSVKKADMFYGSRPLYIFRRLLRLGQLTSAFNIALLIDWKTGNLEKNQPARAKDALALVTQLGPTFIKLGQALSIRTDLIPEAYALELRQLQDAVPPFDNDEAKEILRKELGVSNLNQVFKSFSQKAIASASIGQVYKGELLDGKEVAIKIQRPNILSEIALDLYLLRLLTPLQVRISNAVNKVKTTQDDIDLALKLVDEWGRGFIAEVDYGLEARNTMKFIEAMQKRGLASVTAPSVFDTLSGPRVIVTEWIEGTRLDFDASPDVPRLCSVAINAYLTMLLDTGVLHCDPHAGNLLRTKDGRLCILDWGMTLEVPRDLQFALLEFIAHINVEDFEALPQDFVNLGFSPNDRLEQLKNSGITEGLSFALRQLNKGGGPGKIRDRVKAEFQDRYGKNLSDDELRERARTEMIDQMKNQLKKEGVDVNGVTNIMEEMSRRNRELFQLPPYVLYVSRAFSTLEGIGLQIDEDYSILQECYPYLASRLLRDDSPRAKNALRAMLFGANNSGINANKLIEMSENFESFESFSLSTDNVIGREKAEDALRNILVSPEGNYIQDILVEEAARVTDSLGREAFDLLKKSPGGMFFKNIIKSQMNIIESLPLPQSVKVPISLPYEVLKSVNDLVKKDENDQITIDSAKTLYNAVQPRVAKSFSLNSTNIFESVSKLPLSELPTAASFVLNISRKYGSATFKRAADRFESRIEKKENKNQSIQDLQSLQVASSVESFEKDQIRRNVRNSIGRFATTSARAVEQLLTPTTPINDDDV